MDKLVLLIVLNLGEAAILLVFGLATLWWSVARLRSSSAGSLRSRGGLSVRGFMLVVAWCGMGLGFAHWLQANFATVYAPMYSEEQFRRISLGMTRKQVESIAGSPLRKDAMSQRWSPFENWIYSDPPPPGTIGDNYWRRWVMFDRSEGGKVVAIVDDYYED